MHGSVKSNYLWIHFCNDDQKWENNTNYSVWSDRYSFWNSELDFVTQRKKQSLYKDYNNDLKESGRVSNALE